MACACTISVLAAQAAEKKPDPENPIGGIVSVPIETVVDFGAPNGSAVIVSVAPFLPVRVGDWNLIHRPVVPLVTIDGQVAGKPGIPEGGETDDREIGLGDLNYNLYFAPADTGDVAWGLGPSLLLPTASEDAMGTGKWSAGPTGMLFLRRNLWTSLIFARQLWSFAGDDDRPDVNQFVVRPLVIRKLQDRWFLFSDPVIHANWNREQDQRWTVPLGGGAGRLVRLGGQPTALRLGAFYNVVAPDGAPKAELKLTVQFVFPK